jgi:hypothetical protein
LGGIPVRSADCSAAFGAAAKAEPPVRPSVAIALAPETRRDFREMGWVKLDV